MRVNRIYVQVTVDSEAELVLTVMPARIRSSYFIFELCLYISSLLKYCTLCV